MPGISFLFKKKFHPARMSNQKKLFIAEQTVTDREKNEHERNDEIKKELETKSYQNLQSLSTLNDPRHNDLKFMYSQPKDSNSSSSAPLKQSSSSSNTHVDQEDNMVKAFKQKLEKKNNSSSDTTNDDQQQQQQQCTDNEQQQIKANYITTSTTINNTKAGRTDSFGASAHRSKLEDITGKKRRIGLSQAELSDRFSFLKNASMVSNKYTIFIFYIVYSICTYCIYMISNKLTSLRFMLSDSYVHIILIILY